uniref:Uncharacterized protein n=1 Tax=Solanum tuberosum TaxID=4113 RepID=M1DU77_SOLTU
MTLVKQPSAKHHGRLHEPWSYPWSLGSGTWIEEQSKDTNLQEGSKRDERMKKRKHQVGENKQQSANRRMVMRCSIGSPKVTNLVDGEVQRIKAMELTKGKIAEWIGEPDLLGRVTLRNKCLATINTFLNT